MMRAVHDGHSRADRQRSTRRRPIRTGVHSEWSRRLRRRLAGSRPMRRAARSRGIAVVVAMVLAITVSGFARDARLARAQWGTSESVVVALGDLAAGDVIGPEDVTLERRPIALVPHDALRALPVGRRVTAAVARGETVIGARVTPGSTGANGAVLSGDAALVTVPRSTRFGGDGPVLSADDRIDLYASDAGDGFGPGAPATNVASDAVVHEVHGDDVTLRIRRSEAQAVASALLNGSLTLVVVG